MEAIEQEQRSIILQHMS